MLGHCRRGRSRAAKRDATRWLICVAVGNGATGVVHQRRMNIGAAYLDEARRSLRGHKRLAEGAFAQLSDEEFFRLPDAESNSVAIVAKHIAGNLRSRFTDFLTSD